ncbi:MAG: peptidoglycan-binding protein LysM [Gammaproteobacteria bacterium]|nr:peptidoglycan-binding protein LysM [Gammaproteobacteria bacterium]
MSLFGFARDIGRKLFNSDDKAAETIKNHIEEHNPGVTGLAVTYDAGIVGLEGTCASVAAFEKCVLMAGNVKGVVDVYTSGLKVAASAPDVAAAGAAPSATGTPAQQSAPAPATPTEYYVIKSGDTLSKIAQHYYGKASAYPRIFEANREVIEDPDKIYPGQKIRIPLDH